MFFREYDNLGEAHKGLNLAIIENSIIHRVVGPHSIIPPGVITLTSSNPLELGELNLFKLGYTTRKLALLKRNYLDDNQAVEHIREGLSRVRKGREYTYNFSSRKTYKGLPKPNCLLQLNYHKPFNQVSITWRTTELAARWGADLILISELLSELGLRPDTLNLVLLHSYQELMVLPGICELGKWEPNLSLASPDLSRVYHRAKANYYSKELNPNNIYDQWRPIKLVQDNLIKHRKEEEHALQSLRPLC